MNNLLDPGKIWQDYVAAAVLGTGRRTGDRSSLPPALERLVSASDAAESGPPEGESEAAMLRAAAALSLYRRAGRTPGNGHGLAEPYPPSPEERRRRCSPASGQRLAIILDGQHAELLGEWVETAALLGLRAPEELLSLLLDRWNAQSALEDGGLLDALQAVLGERGRWLAAQNPDWDYVVYAEMADRAAQQAAQAGAEKPLPEEFSATWQTAVRPIRRLMFARLRRGCPPAARVLLEASWAAESAQDRAAFLAYLQEGLSQEDELFLESALDDRSKEVRSTAAELLAHLPAARRTQRLKAALPACLAYSPGRWPLRKARLEVSLLEELPPALKRDLAEPKPPWARGMGEKAWWLFQMIAGVPPETWRNLWNTGPETLFELAGRSEWKDLLLGGWSLAVRRFGDLEWAAAFLRLDASQAHLVDVLPDGARDRLLIETLQSEPILGMGLVYANRRPWGPSLSQAVVHQLRQFAARQEYWQVRSMFKEIARWLDPSLADGAIRVLSAPLAVPDEGWERAVQTPLAALEFRQGMHRDFMETESA